MNPFTWIRRKAAEAIVLGTADGLRAVTPEGETPPIDLADLRALLATSDVKTLAAAPEADEQTETTPAKRRGK